MPLVVSKGFRPVPRLLTITKAFQHVLDATRPDSLAEMSWNSYACTRGNDPPQGTSSSAVVRQPSRPFGRCLAGGQPTSSGGKPLAVIDTAAR